MKKVIYLMIVLTGLFTACTKVDNPTPILAQTFEIDATSFTKWKYFSFERNDTVTVTDPLTSTAWDLAFQRTQIKTNGGLSGKGLGSAANSYQKKQAGFDGLKVVSDTATFEADKSVQVPVQGGFTTINVNPELTGWFTYQLADAGTQIVPTDYVYVIKTATGKFAKVWFMGYYSAAAKSGNITFQYKYQPDGSKNLE
jgi:hypothetical protein